MNAVRMCMLLTRRDLPGSHVLHTATRRPASRLSSPSTATVPLDIIATIATLPVRSVLT